MTISPNAFSRRLIRRAAAAISLTVRLGESSTNSGASLNKPAFSTNCLRSSLEIVPFLCLAQLNRQAEASKDNRPKLSHLRESGAIEQDADVVMFVHREEYYRSPDEREQFAGQAEIIIAKQRNGPIGDVELVWRKEYTRFADPASEHYDEFENFNNDF